MTTKHRQGVNKHAFNVHIAMQGRKAKRKKDRSKNKAKNQHSKGKKAKRCHSLRTNKSN
jgi:hypothetical protein